MSLFSGIPEIDINFLVRTSDADLPSVCRIDKYANSLCRDNYFWLERIRYYFSDETAASIPDQSNAKYWYYKLRTNKLAKTLQLKDEQLAISTAILNNIPLAGAEVYRSLDQLLPLAITTGSDLDYFLDLHRHYLDLILATDNQTKYLDYNLYDNSLAAAINVQNWEVAAIILERYQEILTSPYRPTFIFLVNAIEASAKQANEDYFNSTLLPLIGTEQKDDLTAIFISSLIGHHHNNLAKKYIRANDNNQFNIESFLRTSLKFDNKEIENFLKDKYDITPVDYVRAALRVSRIDLIPDYGQYLIYPAVMQWLISSYPEIAMKYPELIDQQSFRGLVISCSSDVLRFYKAKGYRPGDPPNCTEAELDQILSFDLYSQDEMGLLMTNLLSQGRVDLVDYFLRVIDRLKLNKLYMIEYILIGLIRAGYYDWAYYVTAKENAFAILQSVLKNIIVRDYVITEVGLQSDQLTSIDDIIKTIAEI